MEGLKDKDVSEASPVVLDYRPIRGKRIAVRGLLMLGILSGLVNVVLLMRIVSDFLANTIHPIIHIGLVLEPVLCVLVLLASSCAKIVCAKLIPGGNRPALYLAMCVVGCELLLLMIPFVASLRLLVSPDWKVGMLLMPGATALAAAWAGVFYEVARVSSA